MKKTLIALSVLALLTACSSTDTAKMDELDNRLTAVEAMNTENMDALADTKAMMASAEDKVYEAERKAQAINTFMNPESVFSKSGIEIVEENGVPTLIMPNAVTFDLNSADIKPEFKEMLDTLAEALMEYPQGEIRIEGHTDTTGTAEYNMSLSKKRAESAEAYLVDKGIDEARIETEGKGETEPRYSNTDAEGRMKNRRIEISLFRKR
jgi:outer membrane protein OmpA-like peptidoglycan-associated protein